MTREEMLADFLARKGATKCPPADSFAAQAAPLKRSRRDHERDLADVTVDDVDHEVIERERATEARYLEIQGVRS